MVWFAVALFGVLLVGAAGALVFQRHGTGAAAPHYSPLNPETGPGEELSNDWGTPRRSESPTPDLASRRRTQSRERVRKSGPSV